VNGTSAPSKEQRINYFPPVHYNWTIINLDNTLTNEQIQAALDSCNVSVDLITKDSPIHPMIIADGNRFGKPAIVTVPWGDDNFTVTVINRMNPGLQERGTGNLGGTIGNRSVVIHSPFDNNIDLGMRLFHEMQHGEGFEPDLMYSNDTEKFTEWMESVGYPYSDFFENQWEYKGTMMNYRINGGQETLLNYHKWVMQPENYMVFNTTFEY
jgi:hypothetical protein